MGISLVLGAIPWTDVINAAPTVIENAKKLWNAVAKKKVDVQMPVATEQQARSPEAQAVSELESRLSEVEARTSDLYTQMRESTELIKALAEQNGQLIAHIETNRKRVFWLIAATTATAVVAVACLILVLMRSNY